ncbi:hypothetical protein SAMN05660297_01273 [Natronincola peptidivorans]|uniref:Uncharacterized protein n=1 Tax=Natronincola peptidivorans TaxID=426128 RepID=A0A1I0BHN7_9FIRM|nr:hypothetical protein [Natronincola peptidivorans]SET06395.1 hypothetical protein SAMN05660297_01273 [Natronincola peptidivorans]
MENLTIIKLLLSFFIIVSLAEISKRVSPQLGGTLSGLPLGAGLSIYFISYEQGIDFTIQGIPWGIAGLSASIFFCFVYFLIVRSRLSNNKFTSIIIASIAGIISFLAFGLLISSIEMNMLRATLIFMLTFILNIFIINRLIDLEETVNKSTTTFVQLAMRGIVVGLILLFITGVASMVGSRWAVILSAFPSTLFPLLLVVHYEAGSKSVQSVIHAFSYSISTLVVFYFSVMHFVPIFGLNIGFLLIYAVCIIYIVAFKKIQAAVKLSQLKSKAS